jgi:hypothetical protein
MLRVALMVLAMLASYDHVEYNGKFTSAALQASSMILHQLRVI